MLAAIKRTVARVEIRGEPNGTAFLIHRNYVATALHVLDGHKLVQLIFVEWPQERERTATLKWRQQAGYDIAILELDRSAPPDIEPLPWSSSTPALRDKWMTFGFPRQVTDGHPLSGNDEHVADPSKRIAQWDLNVIQLYTPTAQYDLGGFSGAPCVVGRAIVGVIAHQLRRTVADGKEAPVRKAELNTLFALPIGLLAHPQTVPADARLLEACQQRWERAARVEAQGPPPDPSQRRPIYHKLPLPLGDIFGRDEELAKVRQALQDFRFVVVAAPRGVGKTTLVLHTLHRLTESPDFDALIWTTASEEKSAFSVSHVVEAISNTLDFPFYPQSTTQEKIQRIVDEIVESGMRCLLTVDNYESITDVATIEFLTQGLPDNCSVLLTSASNVQFSTPRMTVLELDELSPQHAMAFLRKRAKELSLDSQLPADVAAILSKTGGNVLAIEWLVAQMQEGRLLESILSEDDDSHVAFLDKLFQDGWDLLTEDARRLLCAVAMFRSPPLSVLVAVCQFDNTSAALAVQQLRRLYLVKIVTYGSVVGTADPQSRFVLHPITREFAEYQLARSHAKEFYPRAAAYFAGFITGKGGVVDTEKNGDLLALNQERPNILAVLEGCCQRQDDRALIDVVLAAARWLFIEGHWEDLEAWTERGIDAAGRVGDRGRAARLWAERGRLLAHRSKFGKADEAFAAALALAMTPPPDLNTLAYLKHHMGEAAIRRGRLAEARVALDESQALFQRLGNRRETIGVKYRIAILALAEGKLEEARDQLERGIEDTIDESWERMEGLYRRVLAELEVKWQPPRHEQALHQLAQAMQLITQTDTRSRAQIELARALIERERHNTDSAIAFARTARHHFAKLKMRNEIEQADGILLGLGVSPLEAGSVQPASGAKDLSAGARPEPEGRGGRQG